MNQTPPNTDIDISYTGESSHSLHPYTKHINRNNRSPHIQVGLPNG